MEIKTKLTFQIKGLQIKFDPANGIFQNNLGWSPIQLIYFTNLHKIDHRGTDCLRVVSNVICYM